MNRKLSKICQTSDGQNRVEAQSWTKIKNKDRVRNKSKDGTSGLQIINQHSLTEAW